MATTKKKKDDKDILKKESLISEAYFTAIFWNNPDMYNFFPEERINSKTFQNPIWGFFFGLGRYMHEKGVKIFDDISATKHIEELKLGKKFEKYGGYETINEVMDEVTNKEINVDAYYDEIKKYSLLKSLKNLFGDNVLKTDEKYNYKKMTKDQLFTYWNDKVNRLGMDGDNKFDEYDLLSDLKNEIQEWDDNPATGLPFYNSKQMTRICTGWDFGHLYIFGGFGGSGKTSVTFNKVIMSCIAEQEQLLVIANEQSVEEFKKMLIITAMGVGTRKSIKRQRINEGGFSEEEFERMNDAVDWVYELCGEIQNS